MKVKVWINQLEKDLSSYSEDDTYERWDDIEQILLESIFNASGFDYSITRGYDD